MFSVVLQVAITALLIAHPHIYCSSQQPPFFNPLNYLDQLPSLKMPYVHNIPIPNIPLAHIITPTPALTTKVISVVTTYIARNPVCIKSSGKKKPACKKDATALTSSSSSANQHLITKEYFVNNRVSRQLQQEIERAGHSNKHSPPTTPATTIDGSEPPPAAMRYRRIARAAPENEGNAFEDGAVSEATPKLHARKLINAQLKDLLIEDRLDRLEDMLPHYTRMRVYQTSTITVTRTRTARMATATLMVKNCVPDGIDYCTKKSSKTSSSGAHRKGGNNKKRRKSKVAVLQSAAPSMPNYSPYYYG